MKRTILFILLLFYSGILFSADYSKIDNHSVFVPLNLKTANDISRYLTKNLSSPTDKVRAIYYWIAHNIRYDVAKMNSNATYTDSQQLVDEVLKTRKGVCANYAALFNACCLSAGIQSYIIEGYTRQNGKVISIAHAWNAVKINGSYYDIDVTWAAGYVREDKYEHHFRDNFFMISSDEFIKTHMPFDPIWQFSTKPITHKGFETGDFSNLKSASSYNYSDSIKLLGDLSSIERLERENQRIIKSGITNNMIRNYITQNQQLISTDKYNIAANAFNKGIELYNEYILHKNKQFDNLSMKDAKILELLSSSRQLIASAEQILSTLKTENHDLSRSSVSMEKSIKGMNKNLDVEDAFASKYINTTKPFRLILFYKLKQ